MLEYRISSSETMTQRAIGTAGITRHGIPAHTEKSPLRKVSSGKSAQFSRNCFSANRMVDFVCRLLASG